MNDSQLFELLKLMSNGVYVSDKFNIMMLDDCKISVYCKRKRLLFCIYFNPQNETIEIIDENKMHIYHTSSILRDIIGEIHSLENSYSMLASTTYLGYSFVNKDDVYYFRKFDKMYKLVLGYPFVEYTDYSPNFIILFNSSYITIGNIKFAEFINIILTPSFTKSANKIQN
jgi:hypothetical protein